MNVTAKALWYIEGHLNGDLSLEAIADVASVSRFHLSRAFPLSTGVSLSAYVRARRLSEAAKVLVEGAPDILTVALDAGYGSHEAFTRAFSAHFGLTPEQLRSQAHLAEISATSQAKSAVSLTVSFTTPTTPGISIISAALKFASSRPFRTISRS